MNPDIGYNPVGILDGNPLNTGRHVHGVTILGDYEKLAIILADNSIDGVVITGDLLRIDEQYKQILSVCKSFGCWVRVLRLEFELLEGINEFNNKYPGA